MEFRELTERYDLARILHSGRSATVMRATDKRSGQEVVVKMIQASPAGFEEAAARFEASAAALAVLRHPSLPAVLDSGLTQDGGAFLVFELLEGRTLDSLAGKLPPEAGIAFLGQALDGLEALAARGLAHGNVSPDNLFAVAGANRVPRVKLLGLGSGIFRHGAAAPELAQGGVPTARSDVFSFGLTACHLLGCGVAPGDSPAVQLPFALALEVENDAAFREILERMLRRDPAERPALREVRAAFQQALGEPATVAPISPAATMPMPVPAAPPAPAPAPAAPPPPPPMAPASAPIPEGEVLQEINDEVLDALSAPPPPPPVAVAAAPAPPARSNRAALYGAIAAAVAVAVLGGLWGLRNRPEPDAVSIAGPAAPPIPPPPAPQAVMAKLEEARLLLAQGEDRRAQEIVQALSSVDQSALPPAACARLGELEGLLALLAADRLPSDLARGLKEGDLGLLRAAVATGSALGTDLPAGLQGDFERARKLVELHRLIEADAAEGKHAAVLERFAELEALAPGVSDPLELRAKAAQALESEAEALAAEARYDEALAKLAPLEAAWSGRQGLSARAAAYRKSKVDEPKQAALLASLPAWERRKKPHEALDLLRGVEPTPHLRPQLEEARQRLEGQLAQLDKAPPEITLRDGYFLEYSRGAVVELSFRVSDDYQVRSVKLMARPPGGKMREYPLEVSRTAGYYTAKMPSSFHQNGTVELYVVATDISGHEGRFGSADKPMKLTRIGSNRV
ncbi:MAG: protein kinase domain-containing protein [Thermoanaerobaculia bacterium]